MPTFSIGRHRAQAGVPKPRPVEEPKRGQDFFSDRYVASLLEKGERAYLVATGWSDLPASVLRLVPGLIDSQVRFMTPHYLLCCRLAKAGGDSRLLHLGTRGSSLDYRRYLYQLVMGTAEGFSDFDGRVFKEVVVEGPKKGVLNYEMSSPMTRLNLPGHEQSEQALRDWLFAAEKDPQARMVGFSHFNSALEGEPLARSLGLPYHGLDPKLLHLGTKSESRKSYRDAGVSHPFGTYEPVFTFDELVRDCFYVLSQSKNPRVVIKLEDAATGVGNQILDFYEEKKAGLFRHEGFLRESVAKKVGALSREYLDQVMSMGAVVESLIHGAAISSPATMAMIEAKGQYRVFGAYDQLLGGPQNQRYMGAEGPPIKSKKALKKLCADTISVAELLAQKGVRGHFGMDFVVSDQGRFFGRGTKVYAIENNIRYPSTMVPYRAGQALLSEALMQKRCFRCVRLELSLEMAPRQLYDHLLQRGFYDPLEREGAVITHHGLEEGYLSVLLVTKRQKDLAPLEARLVSDLATLVPSSEPLQRGQESFKESALFGKKLTKVIC